MPDPTRETLKRLAESLRKAAGLPEPAEPATPKLPGTKPPAAPGVTPRPAPAKRAEGTPASPAQPHNDTVGAVQPAPGEAPRRAVP